MDLPVRDRAEAIEKINWYAMRWKIEVFHKILKSGCKAEEQSCAPAGRFANPLPRTQKICCTASAIAAAVMNHGELVELTDLESALRLYHKMLG